MLRLTTFAGRVAAVSLSAGVHAAVLFTSLGHPRAASGRTDDAVEVEITQVETPAPDAPAPVEARAPLAAWHPHTHPYPVPESHDWLPHDPSLVHTPSLAPAPVPALAPTLTPTQAHAPAPAAHPDDDTPTFTIAIGDGSSDAHGAVASGAPAGGAPHVHDAPLPESSVDGRARLVQGVSPSYPEAARAQGIEGSVALELVVDESGAVESARVVRGVGHGLDEAAVAAARAFHFAPATRGGHPVRVRMAWSVDFRFRD